MSQKIAKTKVERKNANWRRSEAKVQYQEICSKHLKFIVGIYFQSVCKINNFSNVTIICPKYYCTQLSRAEKKFWRNVALTNLKMKK